MKRWILISKPVWKLVVLLFLVILTFSYAMFQGGFVSWFLFYSFAPFALYAILLSLYSMKQIDVARAFSKVEWQAGDALTVTLSIKRSSRFPLFYLLVEDQLSDSLAKLTTSKTMLFPLFRKEVTFTYELASLPRGEHHFQQVTLRYGDLLGLVEKKRVVQVKDKCLVYPHIEELVFRPFENRFEQGKTASRERVQRDTTMVVGIREYQPGDKFSWINWKASAKRNEFMTKEFEQRQSHDLYVLMDCAPDERFETTVSFTASMLKAIIRKGAGVGLFTLNDERTVFPVRGGEDHLQQLFYHLAQIRDVSNNSLDQVLGLERQLAGPNTSVILITSQLTRALIEKATFFSMGKGVTIFLTKHAKESISSHEVPLKQMAHARGITVVPIMDGEFEQTYAEVNRR